MDKAYLLIVSAGDGSAVSKEWEPPLRDHREETLLGLPDDQALIIGGLAKDRVPEVLGTTQGPFVLAPAVRIYLEESEPQVHRFQPVRVRLKSAPAGSADYPLHWMLIPPPRIDCLNLEGTVMAYDIQRKPWSRTKEESRVWGGGVPYGDDLPCILERQPIAGRHLWRVAQGAASSRYACSTEFWRFYKSQKMIGWEIYKTCEVK